MNETALCPYCDAPLRREERTAHVRACAAIAAQSTVPDEDVPEDPFVSGPINWEQKP